MADHYDTLHLSQDASQEEVRQAIETIREKMGSYAPGIVITDELISQIHPEEWNAFTVLSDPETRMAYDELQRPPEVFEQPAEVIQKAGFITTFLSYAAAIGLMCAIILFLAVIGGYLL